MNSWVSQICQREWLNVVCVCVRVFFGSFHSHRFPTYNEQKSVLSSDWNTWKVDQCAIAMRREHKQTHFSGVFFFFLYRTIQPACWTTFSQWNIAYHTAKHVLSYKIIFLSIDETKNSICAWLKLGILLDRINDSESKL